ncbi:MAG: hypothetical protein PHS62_02990 [Patescibacteria group bacterium]|nr:hypothetical protein [Patescibacteria group bacterium]
MQLLHGINLPILQVGGAHHFVERPGLARPGNDSGLARFADRQPNVFGVSDRERPNEKQRKNRHRYCNNRLDCCFHVFSVCCLVCCFRLMAVLA